MARWLPESVGVAVVLFPLLCLPSAVSAETVEDRCGYKNGRSGRCVSGVLAGAVMRERERKIEKEERKKKVKKVKPCGEVAVLFVIYDDGSR